MCATLHMVGKIVACLLGPATSPWLLTISTELLHEASRIHVPSAQGSRMRIACADLKALSSSCATKLTPCAMSGWSKTSASDNEAIRSLTVVMRPASNQYMHEYEEDDRCQPIEVIE